MTAPSLLRSARTANDRRSRVRLMAETMRHHEAGTEAGCTFHHLNCAGFTSAEIHAYRDEALALLSQRPPVRPAELPGRMEGYALVRVARAVRRRVEARKVG